MTAAADRDKQRAGRAKGIQNAHKHQRSDARRLPVLAMASLHVVVLEHGAASATSLHVEQVDSMTPVEVATHHGRILHGLFDADASPSGDATTHALWASVIDHAGVVPGDADAPCDWADTC